MLKIAGGILIAMFVFWLFAKAHLAWQQENGFTGCAFVIAGWLIIGYILFRLWL